MIFHTPASTTLKGEKAHASVKRIQLALEKIARVTGQNKYNPANYGGKLDGVVDATTIWALYKAVTDGLAQIPALGWVVDKVGWAVEQTGRLPGVDSFDVFRAAYRAYLEEEIDPYIVKMAGVIDRALDGALGALESGGGPGAVGPMVMQVATMVPQYPAGSFVIRDPKLNKYRILVPIE